MAWHGHERCNLVDLRKRSQLPWITLKNNGAVLTTNLLVQVVFAYTFRPRGMLDRRLASFFLKLKQYHFICHSSISQVRETPVESQNRLTTVFTVYITYLNSHTQGPKWGYPRIRRHSMAKV